MTGRRWIILIPVYLALLVGGWYLGEWLRDVSGFEVRPMNEPTLHYMIMLSAGLFVVASAIPFVPGAEIGIGLIMFLGPPIILLVYTCMVVALVLAYLCGRFIPAQRASGFFAFFGLTKAVRVVDRLAPLDSADRLALLTAAVPSRFSRHLLRYRFFILAVVLNLPGNSLLGGGGGIALAEGMSGLFPFLAFLVTVLIAVSPLPLFFLFAGTPN